MVLHDGLGESVSSGGCRRWRFMCREALERGGQPRQGDRIFRNEASCGGRKRDT